MKNYFGVGLAVCMVGIVGYFGYKAIYVASAEAVAESYIEAMINGDFGTVLSINHRPQKQANLIIRAPELIIQRLLGRKNFILCQE